MTLAGQAHAKINLSLVIFGPRPDGYHDLHSVMGMVDLHDDLHLQMTDGEGIQLHCTGRACSSGPENLVYRAAELLSVQSGHPASLAIRLHKRIPLGAGLGGGSSDAAACLAGLNRLWRLGYTRERLRQMAAELGSDVAFFLYGPMAVCAGRGEQVEAVPYRCHSSLVLVKPGFSVSTAEVYRQYRFEERAVEKQMNTVREYLGKGDLEGLLRQGINSLTDAAMQVSPRLRDLRDAIRALDLSGVFLSGSGSTLYLVADSTAQGQSWADTIKRATQTEVEVVSFITPTDTFLEVHHADL